MGNEVLVSIKCLVYNHEPYLRQCLDGFVMQKTNFRFEAIVHDDASTDNSATIIKEYAEKYPDIIKPIYETENQYSKHNGSIRLIMNNAIPKSTKYVAMCEGDDYWIDPLKLQKQVDFLETHSDFSMVCNNCYYYSIADSKIISNKTKGKSIELKPSDIINKGGLYITTCSILHRRSVLDNYPQYCLQCHVGDYPLQIMCAMKGRVYKFGDYMSVYRVNNNNSWIGKLNSKPIEKKIEGYFSEIKMLQGFALDYPTHHNIFEDRISIYLIDNIPNKDNKSTHENNIYFHSFDKEIKKMPIFWKLFFYKIFCKNKIFDSIFYRFFKHTRYKQFLNYKFL